MRKILQPAVIHNDCRFRTPARSAGPWVGTGAVLTLIVMLAGCQGAATDSRQHESAAPGLPRHSVMSDCLVVITTGAYQDFLVAAEQVAATGELSAAELERLAANPTYARYLRSFESARVNADLLAAWVSYGARGRGLVVHGVKPPTSVGTALSMGFSFAEAEAIKATLEQYIADQAACQLVERISGFIAPEDRPDTLYLDFLAGKAELRFFEGHALVDVGLSLASGTIQLNRILSGLLYRSLAAIDGPRPADVSGAAAVYNTLRNMINKGVSAWLDGMADLYFGHGHPRLEDASPIPEHVVGKGYRALHAMNRDLTRLISDPEELAADGDALNLYLIGSNSYEAAGYVMAMVIEQRFGLPRLQQSSRAVSTFLSAYQEAVLTTPSESNVPVGSLEYYFQNLPLLSPEIFPDLLALVEQEEASSR